MRKKSLKHRGGILVLIKNEVQKRCDAIRKDRPTDAVTRASGKGADIRGERRASQKLNVRPAGIAFVQIAIANKARRARIFRPP